MSRASASPCGPRRQLAKLCSTCSASIFLKQDEKLAPKTNWKAGDPVPYAALAETFAKIEATTKRLEILQYLTTFLRRVIEKSPDNLLRVVYLCINRVSPACYIARLARR